MGELPTGCSKGMSISRGQLRDRIAYAESGSWRDSNLIEGLIGAASRVRIFMLRCNAAPSDQSLRTRTRMHLVDSFKDLVVQLDEIVSAEPTPPTISRSTAPYANSRYGVPCVPYVRLSSVTVA